VGPGRSFGPVGENALRVREYGAAGPLVFVLHGGPGSPGHMAPVARGLADICHVLEPFERRSGREPLTVARHVADLRELVEKRCQGDRPALVGSSWGAMLALAFAAKHPELVRRIALVGCGTFGEEARRQFQMTLGRRIQPDLQRKLERIADESTDPDERLMRAARLLLPSVYSYDLLTQDTEIASCDAKGHAETWSDMLRQQSEGEYPASFAAIKAPVLMLHGSHDPHPGRSIAASLRPYLPQLEYHELERCGHFPWLERHAREDFFHRLRAWLVHGG